MAASSRPQTGACLPNALSQRDLTQDLLSRLWADGAAPSIAITRSGVRLIDGVGSPAPLPELLPQILPVGALGSRL